MKISMVKLTSTRGSHSVGFDATSSTPILGHRRLEVICYFHFQVRRASKQEEHSYKVSACYLLHSDFLLDLFLDTEDGDVSPKRRLTFSGLHIVISQNTELLNFSLNLTRKGPTQHSRKSGKAARSQAAMGVQQAVHCPSL
jgi:hypothetical protein